jgi:hypothetical protein
MQDMEDQYEHPYDPGTESGVRTLRSVMPWVIFAGLLIALFVIWTGFRSSLGRVASSAPAGGSAVATASTAASVTPVPTSTVAVTRVAGVQILSAGSTGAKVLMVVKKGTTLQVLERTDAWLHVKEPDGLIGWIANSATNVQIRTK